MGFIWNSQKDVKPNGLENAEVYDVEENKAVPMTQTRKKKHIFELRTPDFCRQLCLNLSIFVLPALFFIVSKITSGFLASNNQDMITSLLLPLLIFLEVYSAMKIFYSFIDVYWGEYEEVGIEDEESFYFLVRTKITLKRFLWFLCILLCDMALVVNNHDIKNPGTFLVRVLFWMCLIVFLSSFVSIMLEIFRFFMRILSRILVGIKSKHEVEGIKHVMVLFMDCLVVFFPIIAFALTFMINSWFLSNTPLAQGPVKFR